jgi:hypothetical protein
MVSFILIKAGYAAVRYLPQIHLLPAVDTLTVFFTRIRAAIAEPVFSSYRFSRVLPFKRDQIMKVETHLKAGGFIQDAWNETGRAMSKAENFVLKANDQAAKWTQGALGSTSKLANCVAYTFNWR